MDNPISWSQFFLIFGVCALTILACRVLPLFLLQGKELSARVSETLSFIPPAAFAALVANDLMTPGMFASGIWPACAPLLAALAVVVVAKLTRSLLWSAVGGVIAYALIMMLV